MGKFLTTRLNLYISRTGLASRRKADALIKQGAVTVNGNVTREPFTRISQTDRVAVNGKPIAAAGENIYLMFNKPRGVVTTADKTFDQLRIFDLLPKKFSGLRAVGRLDKDSRGLLIMTSDGDFCHQLTHPRFEVEKEYLLTVIGQVQESDCRKTEQGLDDEGEFLRVKSAKIISYRDNQTQIKIIVCEGKKRHLRRLFKALGFGTTDLVRLRTGNLRLGNLAEGKYKLLTKQQACDILGKKHQICNP